MTEMKHFPAIWLKCKLFIVLLVQRGSPLEKGFTLLSIHTTVFHFPRIIEVF